MPGSTTETFNLNLYKEALGKDYKRITLYLCTESDIKIANEMYGVSSDEEIECFDNYDDIQYDIPELPLPEIPSENEAITPASDLLSICTHTSNLLSTSAGNIYSSPTKETIPHLSFTISSA